MAVDVERLVRIALRRLRENDMFTTVIEDDRFVVDQVLCGVIMRWDSRMALEYRVVPGDDVHGLSMATGSNARHRIDVVVARVLAPFIAGEPVNRQADQ